MEVRVKRRRGQTRISGKHQVTIPQEPFRRAGLRTGDTLDVLVERPGEVRLVRHLDPVEHFAGRLTSVFTPGRLDRLRREWH